MSGLLVKSTMVMKENLEVMNERSLKTPVILGGAALTKRFVDGDLRPLYKGPVYYANDAFDGLRYMEAIVKGESAAGGQAKAAPAEQDFLTGSEAKMALAPEAVPLAGPPAVSSKVSRGVPIPRPPFWGTKIVSDVNLDELFMYVNDTALIRGQWRFVRGSMSDEEYKTLLEKQVLPDYRNLVELVKREKLLVPQVVYGYFPCQSEGNDLIIYHPPEQEPAGSQTSIPHSKLTEQLRFTFPRQNGDRQLCIADYFASVDSGTIDVLACHLVTVGKKASEYSKKLYDANSYKDYLYFHGFSVESAEALAELWHKKIREELGIAGSDAPQIKKLFSQGYQGSRFSFGYPACPRLEDQVKLFELLRPERIGVTLTEEYQMEPEQSTSAIVVHHPQARYFTMK
jgi:5-methyltetrahydrofolate--homocysteine methyltransferase